MADFLNHLPAFVAGLFTGGLLREIATKVLGDRLTDRWRRREAAATAAATFATVETQMPALIEQMRVDLEREDLVREFFVIPAPENSIGFQPDHTFSYYESEHPGLLGKLGILQNHGYIIDVRRSPPPAPTGPGRHVITIHTPAPRYRMTEAFVTFVRSSG